MVFAPLHHNSQFYNKLQTIRDPLSQIKSKFWIAKFSESIVLKAT